MAIDVKLPELGDGIESGDVLELFVAEGEEVTKEQGLLELETDKATITVPCPEAGKITKLLVSPGQTIAIGDVILQLEASGASSAPEAPQPAEAPAAAPAPAEKPAPAEPQATAPAAPQPAAPQPAPAQPAAPQAATPPPAPAAPAAPAPQPASAPQVAPATGSDVAASPAVRRFAREVGVDISAVSGTGEGGRITRDDVLRSVREASSKAAPTAMIAPSGQQAAQAATVIDPSLPGDPSQDEYGPIRVERLSKIRKTIAAQMHKSWSTVPRVTNFDDADVTDLEAFRKSSKDDYAAQGIKLTTMPFLIKAVATALRQNPSLNAVIDSDNDQIVYRDYVNLGIAVDTDRGLVVPNIRHADSLSIPEIAKALGDLAARVRNGDFGVNELRGGTFTISNLGAIGGTYSTPIVNVPEVAILLVGRTRKLPVVMEDDSIEARQMMPLSLSYDHRLVDGGAAARFLNDVIAYLEAPSRLLLAIR